MPAPAIKICGLTDPAALDAALAAGATWIGLNFVPASKRYIDPGRAAALAARARGRAGVVGLFVDPAPDHAEAIAAGVGLDAIQLHGAEPPEFAARFRRPGREVWKAIPVRTRADLAAAARYHGAADRVLYDAKPPEGAPLPGGTGLRIDWRVMAGVTHPLPWLLAGGLDAGNVAEAMRITGAVALDVASGVESAAGIKDCAMIAAFCAAARGD